MVPGSVSAWARGVAAVGFCGGAATFDWREPRDTYEDTPLTAITIASPTPSRNFAITGSTGAPAGGSSPRSAGGCPRGGPNGHRAAGGGPGGWRRGCRTTRPAGPGGQP